MQRKLPIAIALLVALSRAAAAQDAPASEPVQAPAPWVFSGSLFVVDPPGSDARTTAILQGQRDQLHIEMRYNYEDLDTAAFFGGWTLAGGGEQMAVEFTPMLGLVGGETKGVAPALELDLGWRRVSWYVEAEYLFDSEDSADDFFYSWSTLTYGLTNWLDAGLVSERNKLVETDYEVQVGLALEFSFSRLGLALYSYNLGTNDAYTVVMLGGSI